jgi:hypothetical protein
MKHDTSHKQEEDYRRGECSNPVHYVEGDHPDDYEPHGWYFWDETWTSRIGPHDTEAQANEACARYAAAL